MTEFAGTGLDLPDWSAQLDAATLAVSGSAEGATGRMYLSATAQPTTELGPVGSVQAELHGVLDYRGSGLTVVIEDESALQIDGGPPSGSYRFANPLTFAVEPKRSFIEVEFGTDLRVNHRLIAAAPRLRDGGPTERQARGRGPQSGADHHRIVVVARGDPRHDGPAVGGTTRSA